jgi:cobalt-zinc-cadmium efflux system outer membrane protein
MKKIFLSLALAGMAFVPSLAHPSFASSSEVSEQSILQSSMQYNPDVQAILRGAAEEKADAEQEGRLENPTVDMSRTSTSTPGGDNASIDIEIEQPLKLSQLTGTRLLLSNTLIERANLRQQHGFIQAYWSVKTLYAQTWAAQEKVRLLTQFLEQAEQASSQIQKSVKAGQKPISDGSLFEGDVAKFEGDLAKAQADYTRLKTNLEKSSGLVLAGVKLPSPALSAVPLETAELEQKARNNASLIRLLETDLKAAERQKTAAIADSTAPEIAPRFIYGRNNDANEDSVGFGVVLTIPLWDRNTNERQKADAAKRYAQSQLDSFQKVPLSQRLQSYLDEIERLDTRLERLENKALPNYRKAFKQAQRSFNAGQTDSAALWQIRERLMQTELEALESVLDSISIRQILFLETGILPNEVTQ